MIKKETIDKIFEAAVIEDVIGEFVQLKKSGSNYKGLSPFIDEKTPSFMVSPVKGIFKDFSSGKGGNVVSFLMELEQMSYPEALRWLAGKYNIDIEEEQVSQEQLLIRDERESLLVVLSYAQKTFSEQLLEHSEGRSIGLSYFKERGFREETIEKFQLGYCLDEWNAFTESAITNGHNLSYLEKTGLTKVTETKQFDFFKGRVMFPIHNVSGRVIGFGGRTLRSDKKTAKYFNSPESEVYNKSKVLYGIYFAKKSMVSEDQCFLCEGYTDVISLYQAGIENVVASSGTALTVDQIKLIKRYTQNITILYDGDSAGIKASFRGIDLILEQGLSVKIVLFPEGEDPDSFARSVDQDTLKAYLTDQAQDFIQFKSSLLLDEIAGDPIKKAKLIREIVQTIAKIPDGITRSVYVKECSVLFEIEERTLDLELAKFIQTGSGKKFPEKREVQAPVQQPNQPEEKDDSHYQEKDIIRILLTYGSFGINVTIENEEEEEEETDIPVAQFIVKELDELVDLNPHRPLFKNESYQLIYNEYVQAINDGVVPSDEHFIRSSNTIMAQTYVELTTSPYFLSENWKNNKFGKIYPNTEKLQYKRAVVESILTFKLSHVIEMISYRQNLLSTADETREASILQEIMILQKVKKLISEQLTIIICR